MPHTVPEFFWDTPTGNYLHHDSMVRAAHPTLPTCWQGISIAGEVVTGRAFLVLSKADAEQVKASHERLVLIFPMARPETTELFAYAAAALYAQGGALSHAASIAREQNLTSVTGLGKRFLEEIGQHMASNPYVMVTVDPAQRNVFVLCT